MTLDNKKLGEAVRRFRRLRGMTQVELADKAGISPGTVARLERGELGYTVKNLNVLAKSLDLPATCLAVMGTKTSGKKDLATARLLRKIQQLVEATVKVQSKLRVAKSAPAK